MTLSTPLDICNREKDLASPIHKNEISDHLGNLFVFCWARNDRLSEVAGSVIEMCVVSGR